jgi:hypothetical protein
MNQHLAITLIALLATVPVCAAEREVVKIDWGGFEQQVSAR